MRRSKGIDDDAPCKVATLRLRTDGWIVHCEQRRNATCEIRLVPKTYTPYFRQAKTLCVDFCMALMALADEDERFENSTVAVGSSEDEILPSS